MGLFGAVKRIFSKGDEASPYRPDEAYTGLRQLVFETKPEGLGLQVEGNQVWGLLMEIGFPEAVATLVAIADGTISLYYSSGGGQIGLGEVPGPRAAADAWLEAAQPFADLATEATSFPLPTPYFVRFYLLTESGVRSIEAKEEDLYERHAFAPLFHKGQDLLTQIRLMDDTEQEE